MNANLPNLLTRAASLVSFPAVDRESERLAIREQAGLVAAIVPLRSAGRGDHVRVAGSPEGVFVGRRNGVVWICYEPAMLTRMCAAFDAKPVRRALAA